MTLPTDREGDFSPVALVAGGAVGRDGCGADARAGWGGWVGRLRGLARLRVRGLCRGFGEHPARPPLLLALSLSLVLAGAVSLWALSQVGGQLGDQAGAWSAGPGFSDLPLHPGGDGRAA